MNKRFAKIAWTVDDILNLKPNWTEKQAEEWLASNEKYIQDRTIELGWEVIECLLPVNDEE
jgi:hypothetical protein